MPDYLGDDMRKSKGEEEKGDEIKGLCRKIVSLT